MFPRGSNHDTVCGKHIFATALLSAVPSLSSSIPASLPREAQPVLSWSSLLDDGVRDPQTAAPGAGPGWETRPSV